METSEVEEGSHIATSANGNRGTSYLSEEGPMRCHEYDSSFKATGHDKQEVEYMVLLSVHEQ